MIPQTVKLSDVCEIVMGQAPSGDSYNDEATGLPLIAGAGDFKNGIIKVGKYTTEPTKISNANDIVMSIRASIGDKVWVDAGFCLGRGVAAIRASNKIDKNYLWHALTHVEPTLISRGRGATFLQVNKDDIKDLEIPLPPLAEQQRIAGLLDTADHIIKQRELAIAKLDQLAQSVFVAMFSNIEHITTLSQVAELKRGPFGGALKKEIFVKHGPMVYEQRNAIYDDCKNGKYFITEEKFNEMKDFSVIDNDLIVSCSGTLGKVAKIDKESPRGIINQALLRVRPKKNISSSFLKSAIESVSVQRNLAISSHGSGLQNFPPMAVVKAVPIPLPSFELQMKFESIKEEILKKKIDLINSKNNLENLLKSLQHQSFAVN